MRPPQNSWSQSEGYLLCRVNPIGRSLALQSNLLYLGRGGGWLFIQREPQAYVSTVSAKLGPEAWLEDNEDLWADLLPQKSVERLSNLGANESWLAASDELQDVISSSTLGAKLFGWAAASVTEAKIGEIINKHRKNLLSAMSCADADLRKVTTLAQDELTTVPGFDLLPLRREVSVMYRGWCVKTRVSCPQEQVELALHSALRGHASACGKLPSLPGEAKLCPAKGEEERVMIAEVILKHAKRCRAHITSITSGIDGGSGDQVLDRH